MLGEGAQNPHHHSFPTYDPSPGGPYSLPAPYAGFSSPLYPSYLYNPPPAATAGGGHYSAAAVGGEHQRSHLHVNGPLDYSKDYSAR